MTKQLKMRSIIYLAGLFLYITAIWASNVWVLNEQLKFIWFLLAYLIVGLEAFKSLREKIMEKKFLSEYTMIILATIGAFGIERYTEGVLVMILFELGMLIQAFSADTAKRSIAKMMDIRPVYATVMIDGEEKSVNPAELEIGQKIIIKPGEIIPADACVTSGATLIDTKALTGEPIPKTVEPGDIIYSGCINIQGVIEAEVMKVYEDSTASKIMEMIERAQEKKSESETFVTKFSRIYTPVMLIAVFLIMFYPPLTFSYNNWDSWVYRGLVFLIVTCPTGLVVSIPVAYLGGIASAAKHGIIVKGANYLESMSMADTFLFDKTGTLTKGVFTVQEVSPIGMTEEELLELAVCAESYSNHPIAQSLMDAYAKYSKEVDKQKLVRVKEIPGYGISATYDGKRIHVGNKRLMEKKHVQVEDVAKAGTVIYVAVGRSYAGYILIADELREDAKWTLNHLRDKYKAVLVMLTGDIEKAGKEAAKDLNIDYVYSNLLPIDKLRRVEEFLEIQDSTERVVCVGDGMNDAPILARADVGIAMGSLGSVAAVEAADIVLMDDQLYGIIDIIRIAKETQRVVNQNIRYACLIKGMILILGFLGYFGMWEAIIAEVGVMIVSMLNSVLLAHYRV